MSAVVYRARIWDHTDWVLISVDGEAADDEETMERMEATIDSSLGTTPGLRVQKLNDEGEWEELG